MLFKRRLTWPARQTLMLIFLLLLTPALMATEDKERVRQLLDRMAQANRELDYRGIFTYEHSGILKSIRVVHAVRDGVEFERLSHLNGPEREIYRNSGNRDCASREPGMELPGSNLQQLQEGELERFYSLRLRDRDRVAGRPVTIVNLIPRDDFRYGFVLAIDEASGLLMQALLVGGENRVLERFQFVDLQVGVALPESEYLPADDSREALLQDFSGSCAEASQAPGPQAGTGLTESWSISWLPPGFRLLGRQPAGVNQPVSNRMYSDGMAQFSVFVDVGSVDDLPPVHARRGATVAYLSRATGVGEEYLVCVVGEIPLATAQRVAESVNLLTSE